MEQQPKKPKVKSLIFESIDSLTLTSESLWQYHGLLSDPISLDSLLSDDTVFDVAENPEF